MDAYVRAGVDISGRTVRYAEAARNDGGCRLLRLGCIETEEGALRNLFDGREDERIRAISEALTDAFSRPEGDGGLNELDELRISISSRAAHAFRSPLASEAGPDLRRKHLRRDIDLLLTPSRPLRVAADALHREAMPSGGAVEWVHVLAVEERLEDRLRRLVQGVPAKRVRLMTAAHAAAIAVGYAEAAREGASEEACALGVGWHADRLDYVFRFGGAWRFDGFAEGAEPIDAAYLGACAAARFGIAPSGVDAAYAYGDPVPEALLAELEAAFGGNARTWRPADLPGVSVACSLSEANVSAYASCLGAALYEGEGFFFRIDPSVPS